MVIMRTVFQNSKRKMSEACYCEIFSRNRCFFNLILDFDNKLKEGTNSFCKCCCSSAYLLSLLKKAYLLKRALLLKKILMAMQHSNNTYTGEFVMYSHSRRSLSELQRRI